MKRLERILGLSFFSVGVAIIFGACSLQTEGLDHQSGDVTGGNVGGAGPAAGSGGMTSAVVGSTGSLNAGSGGGGQAGPGGGSPTGAGGSIGSGGAGGMGPVCGNGVIEAGESCDDTNMSANDGCSSTCLTEPAEDCPGNPVSVGSTPVTLTGDMNGKGDNQVLQCAPGGAKDVVYAVTPTVSGTMTAKLAATGDSALAIRSECPSKQLTQATEMLCGTSGNGEVTQTLWVYAGVTYYVIAESGNVGYSLTLSIAPCGDGVKSGLEQCEKALDGNCLGCVLCTGPGEFMDPGTKHCYRLVGNPNEKDWYASRKDCLAWGGDLAGISSKAEFDFIEKHMGPQLTADTWMGGYAIQALCSYAWVNGEPWHTEWSDGQPNATDACIEFYTGGGRRLSDYMCSGLRAYLCERTPAGTCGDGIVQPGEECDGAAPGGTCDAQCKIGFTCNAAGEFEDGASKHCYKVDTTKVTWAQAKSNCADWGGHLAVIESDGENSLIASKASSTTWIGAWEGSLNDTTTIWEYPVANCSYKHWNGGEPSSANDDCVSMHNNGNWYDEPCGSLQDYVCEKEP